MSNKRFTALVIWFIGAVLLFLLSGKMKLASIDPEFNTGILIFCTLSLIIILTNKNLK